MSKPKYYKVKDHNRWVQAELFETKYIIEENKELHRWDVVEIKVPTVSEVAWTIDNPTDTTAKKKSANELAKKLDPDLRNLINTLIKAGYSDSTAYACLSPTAKRYAELRMASKFKQVSVYHGKQYYCGVTWYYCYVKNNELVLHNCPSAHYSSREKAIEALTKRITNKALKGGAFKQDKARTRAENTLKWLLEQDDGDKING